MNNHRAWASPFHCEAQAHLPVASSQDLVLRHLRTHEDIHQVQALRGHIDLAMHSALDPLFHIHEKKETKWASRSL